MKRKKTKNSGIRYVDLVGQPEKRWYQTKKRKIQVTLFLVVLFAGLIVSLIIPLRPKVSESEKRELAKFPPFSIESLTDGSYFKGIDTWFSDTFPFRETFLSANTKLKFWYGFGDKISSLSSNVADEIPDVPTTVSDDEPEDEEKPVETTAEVTNKADDVTEKTTEKANAKPVQTQTLGGVLVAGKAGYEYYNFVQSTADAYAKTVSLLAKKVKPLGTKVYDIIVPTSIDIVLDGATRKSINTSDQKKATEYIYGSMSKNVTTVNIFDALKSHNSEYIYFRTDHHWTALGAYYAYEAFADVKGFKPAKLSSFKKISCGDFLGSFYNDTNSSKLEKNPDELIAYVPPYSTTLTYVDSKGGKVTWPIVYDVSKYPKNLKYSAFAAGDNSYTRIINNDIKKGETCIVVKESFGNAMIPFLAANYKKVYVIDYRYWNGKLSELAEEKGADDIIFINNVSATRGESLMAKLNGISK